MAQNVHHLKPSTRFPNGAWQVRFRDSGGATRRKSFARKADALKFKAGVTTDLDRGDFINPADAAVQFGTLAQRWLAARHDLKPKTAAGYAWTLKKHLTPEWGSYKVGAITTADIQEWITEQHKAGRSARMLRAQYKVLKLVLGFAALNKNIRTNPATGVSLPKLPDTKMVFLTPQHVATLCAALRPRDALLVRFAAFTGLRSGECAALRMEDVGWKRPKPDEDKDKDEDLAVPYQTVRINKALADVRGKLIEGTAKSKKSNRKVPIPEFVFAELKSAAGDRALDTNAYLFPNINGGPMRMNGWVGRVFRPVVRKVFVGTKYANATFHSLRHAYASYLVAVGCHPREMSELMGHANTLVTLDTYAEIMPHAGDAIAARLDAKFRDAKAEPLPANVVNLR